MAITDFFRRLIYSEGVNPLPAIVTTVLFGLMLTNAMTITMVFSFLPQLVKSFGTSEVNTGYYAGLIASVMFVGRFIFSFMWGYLADRKGKKTAAILSATGLMFTSLAFSFSFNFYWAVTTRFLQGCCMGMSVITKSIMPDICDDTNMALGMSILMSAYSLGLIVAPGIGGFLAFPAEQYPQTFSQDSLFERFSILLPNLITVIALGIVIVFSIVFLPRNKIIKNGEQAYLISSDSNNEKYVHNSFGSTDEEHYFNYSIQKQSHPNVELLNNKRIVCFQIVEPVDIKGILNKSIIGKLFRSKECILSSVLYGTFSVGAVGFEELVPLFAATATKYNGLGFSTASIGIVLLIVAIFIIVIQIVCFPKVITRFGPRQVFIYSTLFQAVLFPLIPTVHGIPNRTALWVILCAILVITRIFVMASFVAVNMLINYSVTPDLLGSANGFGMAMSSLGRSFGPTLFGSLFAWSLSNIENGGNKLGFPFNQYFSFLMLSLIAILNSFFASRFKKGMDSKKENTGVETKTKTYMTVSNFKVDTNL